MLVVTIALLCSDFDELDNNITQSGRNETIILLYANIPVLMHNLDLLKN